MPAKPNLQLKIRNLTLSDIKEVYKLLLANRPYVGLNSRYTYFLLAKDFSKTCLVAEQDKRVIAFSSGYLPSERPDTFFSWEIVVHSEHRGKGLQIRLLLEQIKQTKVKYFEGTVNPSNEVSKRNFLKLAKILNAKCKSEVLFTEEDFENDGHEAEILYRIGPIQSE
jgi:L-2,4-diaminobutyric acid acetyltransferase